MVIQITDKQERCIRFIERILPNAKFHGGTNGHHAYEFIGKYLSEAQKEYKRQEQQADEFILGAMSQNPITVYRSSISFRDSPPRVEEEINLKESMTKYFDSVCPSGIQCADDIKEYGGLWRIISGIYIFNLNKT